MSQHLNPPNRAQPTTCPDEIAKPPAAAALTFSDRAKFIHEMCGKAQSARNRTVYEPSTGRRWRPNTHTHTHISFGHRHTFAFARTSVHACACACVRVCVRRTRTLKIIKPVNGQIMCSSPSSPIICVRQMKSHRVEVCSRRRRRRRWAHARTHTRAQTYTITIARITTRSHNNNTLQTKTSPHIKRHPCIVLQAMLTILHWVEKIKP